MPEAYLLYVSVWIYMSRWLMKNFIEFFYHDNFGGSSFSNTPWFLSRGCSRLFINVNTLTDKWIVPFILVDTHFNLFVVYFANLRHRFNIDIAHFKKSWTIIFLYAKIDIQSQMDDEVVRGSITIIQDLLIHHLSFWPSFLSLWRPDFF